tara:strand:- start:11066 stop:11410 length:345 start_codon:yes stop_codon:yes gene_type:complete
MKILSSKETYSYKLQLDTVREQMRQIEENGIYDIAGNKIKKEDKEQYKQLKAMEHHLRQLASGIESPSPYKKPKQVEAKPETRRQMTDEERAQFAKMLSETRLAITRCGYYDGE